MLGLRIPKAHKAITEARVREHPSDVDLRYIIVGFGLVAFIFGMMISDLVSKYADGGNNEELSEETGITSFILIVFLYGLAKLCRSFPRGARWAIFYSSLTAMAGYLLMVWCQYPAMLIAGVAMILYLAIVAYVSVRQIYKYH